MTEAQIDAIKAQKELITKQLEAAKVELDSINWGEVNANLSEANVDEAIIAYFDLGQRAAEGATDLVNEVLASVGAFLDNIFEG